MYSFVRGGYLCKIFLNFTLLCRNFQLNGHIISMLISMHYFHGKPSLLAIDELFGEPVRGEEGTAHGSGIGRGFFLKITIPAQ